MKLQQLRYLVEIERRGLNVSEAAETLFTSQPGISKQIRLLEDELGIVIFERSGKRFTGMTEPGRIVLKIATRILREAENLRRVGQEYAAGDTGSLILAVTHTEARYALPLVVRDFVARHPKVQLEVRQGNPAQIAEWVALGEADIGIATEALEPFETLVTLPVRRWDHCVIAPENHPLATQKPLALTDLVRWPLIIYDDSFAGCSRLKAAFDRQELKPYVVLTALDADVIKTYVHLGLGLGIISAQAFDGERDAGLVALDASHLFESSTTRLALRRGAYIRRYEYDFIELFAPLLQRKIVDRAMQGGGDQSQM